MLFRFAPQAPGLNCARDEKPQLYLSLLNYVAKHVKQSFANRQDDDLGMTCPISLAQRARGYSGQNFARVVRQICRVSVEVIKRISKTFEILLKR